MKIPARQAWIDPVTFVTMLFDLETDPKQENPIQDTAVEERMTARLVRLMEENDAPPEQYERLGLA